MHSTNMAFERYFKLELDDVKNIYKRTTKENNKKGLCGDYGSKNDYGSIL